MARQKTILIVEDSAIQRMQVKKALQGAAEYRLLEAQNGGDGFAMARDNPEINLFILDYNMPEMNGFQMLERVRAVTTHTHTPAVMLTTEVHKQFRTEAKKLGVTAWIVKPFLPESLLLVVDKTFKGVSFSRTEFKV